VKPADAVHPARAGFILSLELDTDQSEKSEADALADGSLRHVHIQAVRP
jgi:hypothetical protein